MRGSCCGGCGKACYMSAETDQVWGIFFLKKKKNSNRLIPKWSGSGVGKENAHSRICVLVENMLVRFILS